MAASPASAAHGGRSPAGLILVINIGQRLVEAVPDDEAGRRLLDRPGRREATFRHRMSHPEKGTAPERSPGPSARLRGCWGGRQAGRKSTSEVAGALVPTIGRPILVAQGLEPSSNALACLLRHGALLSIGQNRWSVLAARRRVRSDRRHTLSLPVGALRLTLYAHSAAPWQKPSSKSGWLSALRHRS